MRASSSRGVTLIELMVTLAVASFVMVGISAAFIAMARNYQATASRRDVQASARISVSFLEDRVRFAGFGVDPYLAIEAWDSFDPGAGALAAGLDFPDAIAVHERDPMFQRRVIAASAASLTVAPALTEDIQQGQILLVMCPTGEQTAYVIAGAHVAGDPTGTGASSVIPLATAATPVANASPMSAPDDRFQQAAKLAADPCFSSGFLLKVDRYAFYVDSFDDDSSASTPNVPYLMLHRGLDVNNDSRIDRLDATPVAEGVEQMQIAYVMNTKAPATPTTNGVTLHGVTTRVPALAVWDQASERPLLATSMGQSIAVPDGNRFTNNPGNIRQVRLTLVTRASTSNPAMAGDTLFDNSPGASAWNRQTLASGAVAWKQLENLANPANPAFNPVGGGYARSVMRLSVSTKNLMMARQFPPGVYGG